MGEGGKWGRKVWGEGGREGEWGRVVGREGKWGGREGG